MLAVKSIDHRSRRPLGTGSGTRSAHISPSGGAAHLEAGRSIEPVCDQSQRPLFCYGHDRRLMPQEADDPQERGAS